MEIKKLCKTYHVDMICDDCGGKIRSTGIMLTTYPALYEHKCDGCGKQFHFTVVYPHDRIEDEGEKLCHYCNVDDDDYYGDIFKDEETGFWFLDHMTGELDERDGGFVHDKIYIQYCPRCGRKLGE